MTEDFLRFLRFLGDGERRFLYKDLAGCDFVFIFVVRRKTPLHDGSFDLWTL